MRHEDYSKEWVTLRYQALIPSDIPYESKINSRTVQVGMTGAGARKEGETEKVGAVIVGKVQGVGGNGWERNGAGELTNITGQVAVHSESRSDISAH